jgi:putative two-component system response regulator
VIVERPSLLAGVSVLVVEDDDRARQVMTVLLGSHGADVRTAESGAAALAELAESPGWAEVLLCDLNLPGLNGLEVIRAALAAVPSIAAILVTGEDDPVLAARMIDLGGFGYMTKPMRTTELVINVHNAAHRRDLLLAAEASAARRELTLQEETIQRLSSAAELRDVETGKHIERMSAYAGFLAEKLGFAPERVALIRTASPMHDIGKIGIRDTVLLKPGKLSPEERVEMESHTAIGYQILKNSDTELLKLGALLALTHHERFDGTGYPHGLAGTAIAIEGRIAAVADVFDALTSDRVYRDALPVVEAVDLMLEERGKHFDPDVLDTFVANLDGVLLLREALTGAAAVPPPVRLQAA